LSWLRKRSRAEAYKYNEAQKVDQILNIIDFGWLHSQNGVYYSIRTTSNHLKWD
jgi:hypothetical protein